MPHLFLRGNDFTRLLVSRNHLNNILNLQKAVLKLSPCSRIWFVVSKICTYVYVDGNLKLKEFLNLNLVIKVAVCSGDPNHTMFLNSVQYTNL